MEEMNSTFTEVHGADWMVAWRIQGLEELQASIFEEGGSRGE
jgi:hypothetical protein